MTEPTTITETQTKTEPDPTNKQLKPTSSWGTLEELLLASAVNRHGINSWDAVADELNHRHTTTVFTPHLCRLKYIDLKRRFSDGTTAAAVDGGDDVIAAVDELRRLRVAELKRDLHRYDLSIVSLQLKVKRLKEEKERSVTEKVDEKIDEIEHSDLIKIEERETPAKSPETDRINDESSNESNKPEQIIEPVKSEPDRDTNLVKPDDSCNGSSNSKENEQVNKDDLGERVGHVDSGELGESAAESRRVEDEEEEEEEGVKECSDVQSTASLRQKEKRTMGGGSGVSSGDENQSLASKLSGANGGGDKEGEGKRKLQSLVDFLDLVRARKCGSVFERRLEIQETPRYKTLIKEHIDLGIIQKRMEKGHYTECKTMFYRDLMLLVNNAIIFFSKRSSEHKFATELRQLITHHFQTHLNSKTCRTSTSTPPVAPSMPTKPEVNLPDHTDLKPKLAITGPVIASRKRSSIVGKLSSSEAEKKQGGVLKKECEKSSSTSFDAMTKKRTRDQGFGQRNQTSKNLSSSSNMSSRPSPTQKPSPRTVLSKGETSESKKEIKKPSVGNSSSKSKQGSRPGKDLLLDVVDSAVKRKIIGNGGNTSGSVRSERHKDQGRSSHNSLNKKSEKGIEERESPRNGRPPKKVAAISVAGRRVRDGGRDVDAHSKKRQRR